MHEYKRLGVSGMYNKYVRNIEDYRRDWSFQDFCFLISLLEYLIPGYSYPENCSLDKFILDIRIRMNIEFGIITEQQFQEYIESCLECAKRHGYLWSSFDEVV